MEQRAEATACKSEEARDGISCLLSPPQTQETGPRPRILAASSRSITQLILRSAQSSPVFVCCAMDTNVDSHNDLTRYAAAKEKVDEFGKKNIFSYLNHEQTVSQEIDHIRAKLKRNQDKNDAKLKSSFPPKRQLRKVSTFKMNEFKTARIIRICLNAEIFFLFKICHSCKFLKPALSVQK